MYGRFKEEDETAARSRRWYKWDDVKVNDDRLTFGDETRGRASGGASTGIINFVLFLCFFKAKLDWTTLFWVIDWLMHVVDINCY